MVPLRIVQGFQTVEVKTGNPKSALAVGGKVGHNLVKLIPIEQPGQRILVTQAFQQGSLGCNLPFLCFHLLLQIAIRLQCHLKRKAGIPRMSS